MSIPYCSVHNRLFIQQNNQWTNWSYECVAMPQHLCDTLDSMTMVYTEYQVVEAACDRCVEIARQILHEQWEKHRSPAH